MALTSGSLQLLLAAGAAAVIGITVWLWPRLGRQRLAPIAARLGLIIVGQIVLAAAVLAYINAVFTFYGSWSELLGSSTVTATVNQQVSSPAAPQPVLRQFVQITGASSGTMYGGAGTTLAIDQVKVVPGHDLAASLGSGATLSGATAGVVMRITIRGQYTGIVSGNNYVYLPPQYFQAAYAKAKFPVVMAFTGYPNDTINLMKLLNLPATASALMQSGQIKPAIVLMVNPSIALPADTECTNVPAGLQVATFFGRAVPLAIERAFRAQTARTGWTSIGYSTGAFCAVKITMLYPGQFSAAVGMSGYYIAEMDRTTGPIYGGSAAYQNENNLEWRLQHLPAPPVSVLVASSYVGEKSLPGTLKFLGLIHAPMRGYSLILPSGGHNYHTWRRELPQSLEWLSKLMTTAGPVSPAASAAGQPAG